MAAPAGLAEEATAVSDYVRVKRKLTTIFLYAELGTDTVHDLRAKVNLITKVPTTDIRFFIDKDGEIIMDENKTLAEQKIENDAILYMTYKKEGSDEWEEIDFGKPAEGGEPPPQ